MRSSWFIYTCSFTSQVFSSKLNPNAPEFIPTTHRKGKA